MYYSYSSKDFKMQIEECLQTTDHKITCERVTAQAHTTVQKCAAAPHFYEQ